MQTLIIDSATRYINMNVYRDVLENKWLSKLVHWCTDVGMTEADFGHIDMRRSEMILVALMQVGREVSLDAAHML